jgi:hypothetical protein
MQDTNQELIRRVLSNILSRLEAGAAQSSTAIAQSRAGETNTVILITLSDPDMTRESNDSNAAQVATRTRKQSESEMIRLGGAHPGLERFASLEDKASNLAPKTCFMEPDRVCVNSGACEMRGY